MYFPESDTYYLWDRDSMAAVAAMINIGTEYDPKALVRVRAGGLRHAMEELAVKALNVGKRSHLEIHCHGLPAELLLGGRGGVTMRTVESFGVALRAALRPGGLIECLACKVACQTTASGNWEAVITAPKSQIENYREEYHGALRLRKTQKYYKAILRPTQEPGITFDSSKQLYGRTSLKRDQPIPDDPKVYFKPDPDRDGLKFCLNLARTTGCVVRAPVTTQYEEASGPSPIGEWENEVFDFDPDGKVEFQGASPYRGPLMNSFDMDRLGTA